MNKKTADFTNKHIIAAFDFDGTISYHDTLLPFLIHTKGIVNTSCLLAMELPILMSYVLGITERQKTKEATLTRFFKGMPLQALKEQGLDFSKNISKLLKNKALEKITYHKQQGHTLILVSATLDVYLEPWGKQMGFDTIITSRLQVDENGCIQGSLIGKNCWGIEKVRRLQEVLEPRFPSRNDYYLIAYGDSLGDKELLAFADEPHFRVF